MSRIFQRYASPVFLPMLLPLLFIEFMKTRDRLSPGRRIDKMESDIAVREKEGEDLSRAVDGACVIQKYIFSSPPFVKVLGSRIRMSWLESIKI